MLENSDDILIKKLWEIHEMLSWNVVMKYIKLIK